MATPGSAPARYLLLLILLFVCPFAVPWSCDNRGGGRYDVVSVARSGTALSARLELVGETPANGPDVQGLSLTARQVCHFVCDFFMK